MRCPKCDGESKGQYCDYCGSELPSTQPTIVNNNTFIHNYSSSATAPKSLSDLTATPKTHNIVFIKKQKNKWISLLLCIFTFCGHKFYEGKVGMGIIYLLTAGLFGIGWIIDIISLLSKPNPYYI